MSESFLVPCAQCHGTGRLDDGEEYALPTACFICHGQGQIDGEPVLLRLLEKFAAGTGGRRTGELMRRGWIEPVAVTEAGNAALARAGRPIDAAGATGRPDWTVGPDGRSNTSERFVALEKAIERLIRDSAHDLIAGRAGRVAGLILAQLAHKHGLRP